MSRAHVALGGNLGNPAERLNRVFAELDRLPHSHLVQASSLYRSAPVGHADQPDFVNAVALLETSLSPYALMHELLELESRHGRVRSLVNGPRTLDLDLLLYDHREMQADHLTLPHPRMHLRRFVLAPLLEVDPDCVIPGRGRADLLLAGLDDQAEVHYLRPPALDTGFLALCNLGRGMVPRERGAWPLPMPAAS
ncbi:MAG: 2-amino-4-hydroxy-6-hydroxymethyldihydropteridine diphosphokinase [Gallionellaceae bacterium]|nr:2-amino-4-hydroxy-6-hydroxymethyldihydropteridine diphosphokinase [Gallionellaceae bacterium]